jgi:ABC-type polysaccharide/polyol phosphate transport system ATPase subunit
MSETVILAEGLGKRYRVGERERYFALRDVLTRAVKAPFRRGQRRRPTDLLWALRDVSFEVQHGEVIGLIGRNGAGKTTLLKILSRITRPTEGFAEMHGRVGSLLEVGTGFHPELTGRENIYLSGAVLGMSKWEIDQKFDIMVAFAEVERFLDTQLKHFSTGMQMRLAFAVAVHLEPEILLVDEVLAVGDLAFQKKCLGKMEGVSKSGRTIVFVSHQINQIRRLCKRVLWIDAGRIRQSGPAGEVIAAYEAAMMKSAQETHQAAGSPVFLGWELDDAGNILRDGSKQIALNFTISPKETVRRGHFGLHIHNDAGVSVGGWGFDDLSLEAGVQRLRFTLPYLPLRPGTYTILCSLFNGGNNLTGGKLLELWNAVPFLAVDTLPLSHQQDAWAGVLNIPANLEVSARADNRKERSEQTATNAFYLAIDE